jgi:hypothetical protein
VIEIYFFDGVFIRFVKRNTHPITNTKPKQSFLWVLVVCGDLSFLGTRMESEVITADHLPDEVLACIFSSFPSFEHVLRGPSQVNRHWARVSHDHDIWFRYWHAHEYGSLPGPEELFSVGMFELFKKTAISRRNFLGGNLQVAAQHQGTSDYSAMS